VIDRNGLETSVSPSILQQVMRRVCISLVALFIASLASLRVDSAEIKVLISPLATNAARIDPRLFGNFIELLEGVVPGTWAEMLNDRSFEGILPPSKWCYYDGSPTICDRKWDDTGTWKPDTQGSFNGKRSAKLAASSTVSCEVLASWQ
jgi:hypothetical protein